MTHLLLIAAGGAIGASGRHLTGLAMLRLLGPNFPFGTMTVNIVGSFAMGVFIELLARRFAGSTEIRLFFATGVLGGFTTFSSFSLDAVVLWERGAMLPLLVYILGSVGTGILALFAGLWLVRLIAG